MGIKIKHTNPSLNEFATDDLIVNINEGALFFKSNTKLFRVQGDNILTTGSLESGIFYEGMDLFPPTVKRIKEQDGGTNPTYWIDNEDIKADVHIGAQVELSSNNPNYPRLAIQPPGHTGGPFTLYARDSATAAYLDWYYPHVDTGNHIMTFKHTGKVGIGKVTDPGYSLTVSGSTSDANGGVLQILTSGSNLRMGGSGGYSWIQSHNSQPLLINPLGASGNNPVGIGTISPSSSLDVLIDTTEGHRYFRTKFDSSGTATHGNGVRLSRRGDATGWAFEYGFESNDLSNDWGGFGGFGDGNSTFDYWYIGKKYNDAALYVVSSSGNVGIGTTAPSAPLMVRGDIGNHAGSGSVGTDQIQIMSNTNAYGAGIGFSDRSVDGSGTTMVGGTWANAGQHGSIRFFHSDSHNTTGTGAVFKFDSDQSLAVDINGNLDCNTIDCTAFNNNSDIRLKTNINNIKDPLEIISKLEGITFEWKDQVTQKDTIKENKSLFGTKHGFIAQEVEKILPGLVNSTREYKSLSYVEVVPILVEAIKEQQKQIDELKKQINE